MAAEGGDNGDRTEEATPERREEFREKGQVAVSREITSVFVLGGIILLCSYKLPDMLQDTKRILRHHIEQAASPTMTDVDFLAYAQESWKSWLFLIVPFFAVVFVASVFMTLAQTRLNWSWKKISPDFTRLNPAKGLLQMVNVGAMVNLGKSIAKMFAVGLVAYLILYSEWVKLPALMNTSVFKTWGYWAQITESLFWAVCGFLFVIAAFDYGYNFFGLEKKLKMTKQEVKEDLKKREVDPYVKGRMKRMQRDIAMAKIVSGTKKATVVVTNPTHFAIALQYEMGMPAPRVVAKGIDFNAMRMREVAKEFDIPIVENKPLARTLYKTVEVGEFIPESLYKTVSEVIRYVFKLKGVRVPQRQQAPA